MRPWVQPLVPDRQTDRQRRTHTDTSIFFRSFVNSTSRPVVSSVPTVQYKPTTPQSAKCFLWPFPVHRCTPKAGALHGTHREGWGAEGASPSLSLPTKAPPSPVLSTPPPAVPGLFPPVLSPAPHCSPSAPLPALRALGCHPGEPLPSLPAPSRLCSSPSCAACPCFLAPAVDRGRARGRQMDALLLWPAGLHHREACCELDRIGLAGPCRDFCLTPATPFLLGLAQGWGRGATTVASRKGTRLGREGGVGLRVGGDHGWELLLQHS